MTEPLDAAAAADLDRRLRASFRSLVDSAGPAAAAKLLLESIDTTQEGNTDD